MQKILLAMNAYDFNPSSIDFAAYVANTAKSKIIGVFLENLVYEKAPMLKTPFGLPYVEEITAGAEEVNKDIMEKNIQLFKDACIGRNVLCSVHLNKGVAADEIIKESRFADLIIADGAISFTRKADGIPSHFVKELLANSECPVIISPFKLNEIDEIVFAYDGSKSSLFAMKQFTYLFPQFDEIKTTLIQIVNDDGSDDFAEKEKIKEWLMMHYNGVHMEILHGEADQELFKKFLSRRNKFLVMGAYGRRMFLSHSTADLVLKTIDIPVFIAHH